jgi:hypothetical protein
MSAGVRLGFTVTAEEVAEFNGLVESELQSRPWVALWAFRIGFDQIQRAGFAEAVEQYCRRKDPTRPRMSTEHDPAPAPSPAESGRLIPFRAPRGTS